MPCHWLYHLRYCHSSIAIYWSSMVEQCTRKLIFLSKTRTQIFSEFEYRYESNASYFFYQKHK
jgi:hypothetical protein